MKPQLFDETQPLEEVLVWGEPGIEALLGQLLPKSRSLFFSYYEVLEARKEFRYLQTLVENEKIQFTRAKDALAKRLERRELANEPKSIRELEVALLQRANEYYETFRELKRKDFSREGIHANIEDIYLQVQRDMKQILQEDLRSYHNTIESSSQSFIRITARKYLLWTRPIPGVD